MYPKKFWNEFRLLEWSNEIFVGMWFDDKNVIARYDNIIKKAIEQAHLKPRFLKGLITGDSIPIDIMKGIIECKLVLFDISIVARVDKESFINSNVMYELGLAHTWRNPEEIIVTRDDDESLPFDIQRLGVIRYDLEDKQKAIDKIKETILFRLDQINKIQNSIVRKAAESLTIEAYNILMQSKGQIFFIKDINSIGDAIGIPILLNLGLIEMLTDVGGYGYHPTGLGREVIEFYRRLSPDKIQLKPDNIKDYKTLDRPDY